MGPPAAGTGRRFLARRSSPRPDRVDAAPGGVPVLLLVNPAAGKGRAERRAPAVEHALRSAHATVSVVRTGSLAEATACARSAPPGSVVVALGGDGFLGAVAAGTRHSGAVLVPLAGGRGNDTVRRLGVPLDPVRAVRAMAGWHERTIDVGLVGGRPFLGVAHAGFDAVANEYGNASRWDLGPLVYLYGGIRAFRSWREVTFTLTVDGQDRVVTGWFVAVGNGGRYGGGLRICPRAVIDDGLLDVVALGRSSILNVVATFLLSYRGRHLRRPGITVERGTSIRIAADRPLNAYADGELVGPLPLTVVVEPCSLRMLLPPVPPSVPPRA
jgi:YegS/Rv2252/BmrU family lipid kinase